MDTLSGVADWAGAVRGELPKRWLIRYPDDTKTGQGMSSGGGKKSKNFQKIVPEQKTVQGRQKHQERPEGLRAESLLNTSHRWFVW